MPFRMSVLQKVTVFIKIANYAKSIDINASL